MTKKQLLEYFENHSHHDSGNGYWPLPSWNIKTRLFLDDAKGEKKWNNRWERFYREESSHYVYAASCEDGMSGFFGDWDFFEGLDFKWLGSYKFYSAGRSGGHLILDSIVIDGHNIRFMYDGYAHYPYENLEYDTLKKLYKFFREIDNFDFKGEHQHQLNFQRENMESQWEDELKQAKTLRNQLKQARHSVSMALA